MITGPGYGAGPVTPEWTIHASSAHVVLEEFAERSWTL